MTKEELAKLTPEQKRIAIAQACGWGYMRRKGDPKYNHSCVWLFPPDWKFGDRGPVGGFELCEKPEFEVTFSIPNAPDYLNDLNAMHEAEKHLETDEQIEQYCEYLTDVSGGDTPVGRASFCAYFSTASQRADAFLLAL